MKRKKKIRNHCKVQSHHRNPLKSTANHHKKTHKPTITDPYSSSHTSHSLPLPLPPSDPHSYSSPTNPPPRKRTVPPPSPLHLHRLIAPTPLSAPPPSKAAISTQSSVKSRPRSRPWNLHLHHSWCRLP